MKYRLLVYVCIIAFTAITAHCYAAPVPATPTAYKGILDLQDWDFRTQGIIELNGQWEFYWNQLLAAEDFNNTISPRKKGYLHVPDSWDTLTVHGSPLENKGYGTYRLIVKTGAAPPLLGMRLKQVFQASKVWINGNLLCSTGTIGTSPETMHPERSTKSFYFQPQNRLMEIIIQVANYHHREGGLREPIEIGTARQIQKKRDRMLAYDLFIFGGLFIIMLYHLGLYLYHRKDIAMLYFAILTFVLAVRSLLTSEIFLTSLMPELRGYTQFKVEYITYYLAIPLLAMFYNSMYKSEVHPVLYKGIVATGFFFSAFVVVTPLSIYSHTVIPYTAFFSASILYMIGILALASYRKRDGALMLLWGFLVLFASAINDLLHSFDIIKTMLLSHFGFLIFVIIQAMVLSKKYARVLLSSEEKEQQLSAASSAYLKEHDERKKIEEDHQNLQLQIGFLLGATKTGIDIIDTDYNIRYIDPEWEKQYGSYKDVKCYTYFMKRDTPCENCGVAKAIKLKGTVITESIMVMENNRPVEIISIPYQNIQGEWLVAEINIDISERKKVEQELHMYHNQLEELIKWRTNELTAANEKLLNEITAREKIRRELTKSETKYRALFDTSPQGIVISTLDGKILEANNAFMNMLKYSMRELQNMTWRDFTPEKWHNMEEEELIKIIQERIPTTYEKEYIRKDGRTFAISLTSWLISENNDEPAKIFTIVSDITERKQAEENLLLDESRLEALLDLNMMGESSINEITDFALKEGVRLTKSDIGYLAFLNEDETVLTMHTWSRNAIEQCNLPETQNVFIVKETGLWGEAVRQRKPVITNDYSAPDPLKKGLPEGHSPIVRHMNVPVFDGKKIVAVAGVGNKTQDYNDSDVRQLTLLMQGMWRLIQKKNHEEELIRARKIESLGILAGGIAHDFNNLLTIIYGNLSLAKLSESKTSQNYFLLHEAEKASLNAKDLTRQLLTFSKGGAPIKTTTSIENLLRDTVNFVLSGSNVRAAYSIPPDLWGAHIDEGQISQVIHNLIINSRQAMPEGGTITINVENTTISDEDTTAPVHGDYIKIEIIDEGPGIPKDNLQKIFDPYFTTKDTGSGLGLAVCYSIVKNHGGSITVQSGDNNGTMFTLYLPAVKDAGIQQKKPAGKKFTGNGKILIMDDDPSVLKITQLTLEHMGYETACSRHGEETIDIYKKAAESNKPFDAVIMDLTIPGRMGGAQTIQKIRELDPGVKAIVASGYSNDPIMARFGEYGFAAVLAKPYRREELGEVLERVIGQKNSG
ncbi:MAG TPA: GAF domain-containing protein [Spirochaetota bacterium]|nr:GAF domain-containing protein [Spirochaetota bacterium]